jgi:hypothetical protein
MPDADYVARVKRDLDRLADNWYLAKDEAESAQTAADRAASWRDSVLCALREKAELYYQLSGEDERYYGDV